MADPVPGVDYFVHYEVEPPNITLRTTEKDGPVNFWRVGRKDPVTGRSLPLGTVFANWDVGETPRNIRVEVGTHVDAPCGNVNVVEIPAQDETTWSSIRLELAGSCEGGTNDGAQCFSDDDCAGGICGGGVCEGGSDHGSPCATADDCAGVCTGGVCQEGLLRGSPCATDYDCGVCQVGSLISRARCHAIADPQDPSFGDGGCVSGTITGMARHVYAEAIGIGASTQATLNVGTLRSETSMLAEMRLSSIPTGSALNVTRIVYGLEIEGEHNGTIHIEGDLEDFTMYGPAISVYGSGVSSGNILVDGDIAAPIEIHGNMMGDIIANADGVDGGKFLDFVTIFGEFNGDICGEGLSAAGRLPGLIDLNFGPNGTICGQPPDCNENGVFDWQDIAQETSSDLNGNGIPDECDNVLYVDLSVRTYKGALPEADCDGSSWQRAYTYLQDALNHSDPCGRQISEIRVAQATYRPAICYNYACDENSPERAESFVIPDGVAVYGGFVHAVGSWYWHWNETYEGRTGYSTLNGDLNGGGTSIAENSHHIVKLIDAGPGTTFDGFHISRGNATDAPDDRGAGIFIDGGSPTISNCLLDSNEAGSGAGIYADSTNASLVNCRFVGNNAYDGGAVYASGGMPEFANCVFSGNTGYAGGAMRTHDANANVVNCTFSGNVATGQGGGVYTSGNVAPDLANCVLHGNSDSGGSDESAQLQDCPTAVTDVRYSLIQGLDIYSGNNNIDGDPLFIDADGADNNLGTWDDNVRLSATSPCNDAGDDTALPADTADLDGDGNTTESVPLDLDLNARLADADGDQVRQVDMGAYEFPTEPPSVFGVEEPVYDKNRYLSFVPGNPGEQTALRVTLTDYHDDGPGTPIGSQWWVGEPYQVCENSGQIAPPAEGCAAIGTAQRWLWVAPLVCEAGIAHRMDWSTLSDYCVGGNNDGDSCTGDEDCLDGSCDSDPTVHVFGAAIVPSKWLAGPPAEISPTSYHIQAIYEGCDVEVESNYSAPLDITMSRWGDVVGDCASTPCTPPDGIINITTDVTAVLDKFKNLEGSPMKVRCDILPDDDSADQYVNMDDVYSALDAFNGLTYPFSSPPSCP